MSIYIAFCTGLLANMGISLYSRKISLLKNKMQADVPNLSRVIINSCKPVMCLPCEKYVISMLYGIFDRMPCISPYLGSDTMLSRQLTQACVNEFEEE